MRSTSDKLKGRAGFTLLELLVVIAIIGILAALAAGAYFRVSAAQQLKRSEATVKKIATGFQSQWNAVIDDVKDEIKNGKASNTNLLSLTGQDRDRVNAAWLKMRLRQEFPQTFDDVNSLGYSSYGLTAKQAYNEVFGLTSDTTASDYQGKESAILLYLALKQNRRGAGMNADDLGPNTVGTISYKGKNFNVFVDAWGTPICFERWGTTPYLNTAALNELTAAPYVHSTSQADSQDPFGKIANWSPAAAILRLRTDGKNFTPVIYSQGPDKSPNSNDDILSFRLLREGQRGN